MYGASSSFLKCRAARRCERAMTLPLVAILTVVIMVMGLAFLEIGRIDGIRAVRDLQDMQALAAAELGLERARVMSLSQGVPWADMTYNGQPLQFVGSGDPLYQGHAICPLFTDMPAGSPSATYSVVVESLRDWPPGYYRLHAFGDCQRSRHHVSMDGITVTYASFGWLTNSENGIYFATDDVVDGWLYTNDRLNIWGDPLFTGRVDSAASSVYYAHGGPPIDNPEFREGLFLQSPVIDMADLAINGHVESVRRMALQTNGIFLPANDGLPYRVEFYAEGAATFRKLQKDDQGNFVWVTVLDHKDLSTTNGAIYIEETVQVLGTLNGQVTVATPVNKDVEIVDNLVYAYPENPSDVWSEDFDPTDPAFDDRLGLIAGRDVVFKKPWSAEWTDLAVTAGLLAATGSIRNAYYKEYPEKQLNIYGGLAQDRRGAVGMISWEGRRYGFVKNYQYDERFTSMPPPHFPYATYDYHSWRLNP